MITKKDLDKRICDVEPCENTETYREFIREAEKELCFRHINIDHLTDNELSKYLDLLDDLLMK